jgi:hypothetical protein
MLSKNMEAAYSMLMLTPRLDGYNRPFSLLGFVFVREMTLRYEALTSLFSLQHTWCMTSLAKRAFSLQL